MDNESMSAARNTARLTMPIFWGEEEETETTTDKPIGDIPGYSMMDMDQNLLNVYVDYIHQNDDMHLDGGILDDAAWQV